MNTDQIMQSLFGGALIGLAATIMLFFNGRVTGISGILGSALDKPIKYGLWKIIFLIGFISAGFLVHALRPELFINNSDRSLGMIAVAGLLVGYGTLMGSGCTSGHGVCGISRLSIRSVVATLSFMFFGFATVQIVMLIFKGNP